MLQYREELEEVEEKTLAPYAVKSRYSLGREHPEEKDPYRTEFQRDWNRLIHTDAFRKLEFKTQVLMSTESLDTSRNRLTHSIEVDQISHTLARCLGLNEDLVRAISLGHDFGHPPFGHSGETELDAIFREYGSAFNHNRHGLKIVRELEKRDPRYPGMNLTREVMEGYETHKTPYDRDSPPTIIPGKNPCLECQIVDLADLIAYSSHDLDDAMQIKVITPEDLRLETGTSFPFLQSILRKAENFDEKTTRTTTIRNFIYHMMEDCMKSSAALIEHHNIQSVDQVRALDRRIIGFSDEFRSQQEALKKYIRELFYEDYRVKRMDNKGRRIIRELYNEYSRDSKILPSAVQQRIKQDDCPKHEVLADYIAGMTDREAIEEYKRIFELSGYQKEFSPV